jgi:hypothetical protein
MTTPLDASSAPGAANSPTLAGLIDELRARRAARATGPRTVLGKKASRANATTLGMRCQVVTPPDDRPRIEARTAAWIADLKPEGETQTWLVARAAEISVRLDRCSERERIALEENTAAAERRWFQERRAWARRLGNRLIERPKKAFAKLRTSAIGIDWLIARWDELAADLNDEMGNWCREERERAVRLLGLSLRETDPNTPKFRPLWVNALATDHEVSPEDLDRTFGRDTSDLEGEARLAEARSPLPDEPTARRNLLAFIRAEQEELRRLRAEVWESVDRPALEAACRRARTFDPGPEATLAGRYERSNAMELTRCLTLLSRLKREASRDAAPSSRRSPFDGANSPPMMPDLFAMPPVPHVEDAPEASWAPNELEDGQDRGGTLDLKESCATASEVSQASQPRPECVGGAPEPRPEAAPMASRALRRSLLAEARRRRRRKGRS